MTTIFEELFLAWCPPYYPEMLPDYLKGDPIRGYGQYAFEQGFRLAMQLAVNSLDPNNLKENV